MNFTTPKKKIKKIHNKDPDFIIEDGIAIAPRAGMEITKDCPKEYMLIIEKCIRNEWLKPVAYMKESEYVWEKLGE
jgi:hypothetical protein